jgi:dTMP kinase
MSQGLFLSFEGIDGCGKTTQLALLAGRLRAMGRDVVETAEPGGTAAGLAIRAILLDPRHHLLDARAELLLYFASRAQNAAEVITPALKRGATVLCDRFTDSTIVYQGAGRGLDAAAILELHRIACGDLFPQLTFLLNLEVDESLIRARQRNRHSASIETRLDDESRSFFERVHDGYLALANLDPARIRVIDACQSIEVVAERIWEELRAHV